MDRERKNIPFSEPGQDVPWPVPDVARYRRDLLNIIAYGERHQLPEVVLQYLRDELDRPKMHPKVEMSQQQPALHPLAEGIDPLTLPTGVLMRMGDGISLGLSTPRISYIRRSRLEQVEANPLGDIPLENSEH